MMPALWKRHFLIFEGALAIVLTIVFAVWFWRFGGMSSVFALLQNNRATLYGTIASIFGSLLGFVITATSVVLGFAASENLSVVRESAQYPMLWRTFSATIRALAGATLVALLCLLVDRDAAPAGLSHLGFSERGKQLGQEGVVPSGSLELSLHGPF